MAQGKFTENLRRLRCTTCKSFNFYTRRKKTLERKLEFKKYCPTCNKHTVHKEAKLTGSK